MIRTRNILLEFEDWLKKRNTKIANRCLNYIDKDEFVIYLDTYDNVLYPEGNIPNYLHDEIEVYARDMNYVLWYWGD